MYESLQRLAAGEGSTVQTNAAQLLDALLDDIIPQRPFNGIKLTGILSGTYLISRQALQVIYEINAKLLTVVILLILDAPAREENARRADLICTQMLLSGRLQILPPGTLRRAAAN
jgi:hypothetical protein